MNSFRQMSGITEVRGVLRVGGLHIGGADALGGLLEVDKQMLRNPISGSPYVPGSSLKGKVRCLLEQRHGKVSPIKARDGKGGRDGSDRVIGYGPCGCGGCIVCELFGSADVTTKKSPTRVVFRDCYPTPDTVQEWEKAKADAETKAEVSIDRQRGTASEGKLRTTERIPAFSDFSFAFSLRTFEGDRVAEYYRFLAEGFELLSKHYLGGSGSRGYGEVAIEAEDGTPMHEYLRNKAQEAERAEGGR